MENENQEPETTDVSDNSNTSANIGSSNADSQAGWGNLGTDDAKMIKNKGWATPLDALASYRELEKSVSSRVALPKADDAEGLKKLDRLLGCPETIEGYDIKTAEVDKPFIDGFKTAALDAGLRPEQVSKLYDWYTKHNEDLTTTFNKQVEQDLDDLKTEWGAKYSENEELMKRGWRMLELDESTMSNIEYAIGTKAFMKLGKKLGDFISEDNAKGLGGGVTRDEEMSTEEYMKFIFEQNKGE